MQFALSVLGHKLELRKHLMPAAPLHSIGRGGWWPIMVHEPHTGAWQRNDPLAQETAQAYFAVYACAKLIASDIAKTRLRLVRQDAAGIWGESEHRDYSRVLRKPNHYQTRIEFIQWWLVTKLLHGNFFALKRRDDRGMVNALYPVDPQKVKILTAPDGSIFYELRTDKLSGRGEAMITVPASEIIHDPMCPLVHPLIGTSPIYACGIAAAQGIAIQGSSTVFFANGAQPGGVITAEGGITADQARQLQAQWQEGFTGTNAGKVAVLADGLTYTPLKGASAQDAQLIEQLKWTADVVCACFGVPPFMIGAAPAPTYNNIQAMTLQYYSQCLQIHIEQLELKLDEGLELRHDYGTEFDLDDLLRMDTAALVDSEKNAVGAGIKAPNEARRRLNLPPVQGGDSPYLQQQNYSLEALARRDEAAPAPSTPTVDPTLGPPVKSQGESSDPVSGQDVIDAFRRGFNGRAA